MDLCNQVVLIWQDANWLAVLCGKTYFVGHDVQTFQPTSFFSAKHIYLGIVDMYRLIPLSVALTWAEDQKVSRKQSLIGSFS